MGIFCFVHGRGVQVKRVASICGLSILSIIIAGCSAPNQRVGHVGAYGTTGSVPIPSEPVYGYGYGKRYGGQNGHTSSSGYYGSSAYSRASDYRGAYRPAGQSHAPFSAGGHSDYSKTSVKRTALAPVSSRASFGGNYFAMQPVGATATGGSKATYQRVAYDYRTKNDGYSGNRRYKPRRKSDRAEGYRIAIERGEYEVEAGDTLYGIAQRFHMTTDELMDLNGLRGSEIHPGQRLRLSRNSGAAPARQRPSDRGGRGYANSYDNSRYQRDERAYNTYRNSTSRRGSGTARDYYDGRDRDREAYDNRGQDRRGESADRRRGYADDRNGYDNRRDSYADERRRYDDRSARRAKRRPPVSEYEGYRSDRSRGRSVSYAVKRGDTLFDIARRNGISHRELADYNDIPLTATLYPGQVLRIPRGRGYDWGVDRGRDGRRDDASNRRARPEAARREREKPRARVAKPRARVASKPRVRVASAERRLRNARPMAAASVRSDAGNADVAVTGGSTMRMSPEKSAPSQIVAATHEESSAHASAEAKPSVASGECESLLANPAQRTARTFREPVQGAIVSKFGAKDDGSFNDGINFSVPKGTPVKAAENGVVAYAGSELAGFGNLILIRHADGFVSAYAHNDKLMVRRCDVVKRGQTISKAGVTGNATKPQLHFELRKDSKPVDPEAFFSRS